MKLALKVDDRDNVATIFAEARKGEAVEVHGKSGDREMFVVNADIPYGHKIALAPIAPDEEIRKYGEIIGTASAPIRPGDHVHVHNLESTRGRGDRAATGNAQ